MARDRISQPGLFDAPEARVFSVSELARALRKSLEASYGRLVVQGEISSLRTPPSGHLYFVLKDAEAQLRAVMFRGDALGLRFLPADGILVEATCEASLFEPRGDLQLLVRSMAPSGRGALMQAFEERKRRLAAEGLFDSARKRPLPAYPRAIAIVTSPSGAAVRDLLRVLGRRWPPALLVVVPVRVQGEGAAQDIVSAIHRVNRWGGVDCMLLGRGGGSFEDLWPFNDEGVARAIATSRIPVVSAVGHETDVTIADFAADVRAPTPSAAAEMAVPDRRDVARRVRAHRDRLAHRVVTGLVRRRREVERVAAAYGFRRPERFLRREEQRIDDLAGRLARANRIGVLAHRSRLVDLGRRLSVRHPAAGMASARSGIRIQEARLARSAGEAVATARGRVESLSRSLAALDPTAVLARGYCLVRLGPDGPLLMQAQNLRPGDGIVVQFSADRAEARVERVAPGGPFEKKGES